MYQRWNQVRIFTRGPTQLGGFWPGDPTQSLSIVKQIFDNGLIAVSVTCQEAKPFSVLIYRICRLSESVLLQ